MNRLYEKLELELVRFTAEDVLTTSGDGCPQEQNGCPNDYPADCPQNDCNIVCPEEQAGCPQEAGCPDDCPDDCQHDNSYHGAPDD